MINILIILLPPVTSKDEPAISPITCHIGADNQDWFALLVTYHLNIWYRGNFNSTRKGKQT